MNVSELIQILKEVKEKDGNIRVRTQPEYIIYDQYRVREDMNGEKFFEINNWES